MKISNRGKALGLAAALLAASCGNNMSMSEVKLQPHSRLAKNGEHYIDSFRLRDVRLRQGEQLPIVNVHAKAYDKNGNFIPRYENPAANYAIMVNGSAYSSFDEPSLLSGYAVANILPGVMIKDTSVDKIVLEFEPVSPNIKTPEPLTVKMTDDMREQYVSDRQSTRR